MQGHAARVVSAEISGTRGADSAAVMVVQRADEPATGRYGSVAALSEIGGLDVHDNEGDGLLVSRAMLFAGGDAFPGGRLRVTESSFTRNGGMGVVLHDSDAVLTGIEIAGFAGIGIWAAGGRTEMSRVRVDGGGAAGVHAGVLVSGSERWWAAEGVVGFEGRGLSVEGAGETPVGVLNDRWFFGGRLAFAGMAPTAVVLSGRAFVRVGEGTRVLSLDNAAPMGGELRAPERVFSPEPGCRPRPELCNGRDEDCDGAIDEDHRVG